nr:hypothetical protein [Micromonospora sp. DSM 115978]
RNDLGDRVGGLAAFAEAYSHARQAGDHATLAWIRCWQSTLARKNGDLSNALALARDAGRWAGPEHPVAARSAVVEAWAHAARGDVHETHDAVGKAWRVVGTLDGDQHGVPGFSGPDSMHTTSIAEMTAGAYVDLGFPN